MFLWFKKKTMTIKSLFVFSRFKKTIFFVLLSAIQFSSKTNKHNFKKKHKTLVSKKVIFTIIFLSLIWTDHSFLLSPLVPNNLFKNFHTKLYRFVYLNAMVIDTLFVKSPIVWTLMTDVSIHQCEHKWDIDFPNK